MMKHLSHILTAVAVVGLSVLLLGVSGTVAVAMVAWLRQ